MDEANLGRLEKVDPSVIDDDPFWSVVRRRHPDVDVVVLPPDSVADEGADPPTADPDAVRTVAADLVVAWRALAPLLTERGEEGRPATRWSARTGGHALLLEKGVRGLGEVGGTDLLRAVAQRLGERGWRLSATNHQGRPRLRATTGLIDFEGEAGAGATMLTLATGVLPVADEERTAVRDDVVEAVSSWQ